MMTGEVHLDATGRDPLVFYLFDVDGTLTEVRKVCGNIVLLSLLSQLLLLYSLAAALSYRDWVLKMLQLWLVSEVIYFLLFIILFIDVLIWCCGSQSKWFIYASVFHGTFIIFEEKMEASCIVLFRGVLYEPWHI